MRLATGNKGCRTGVKPLPYRFIGSVQPPNAAQNIHACLRCVDAPSDTAIAERVLRPNAPWKL
jgi:hypothetical protein